MSTIAWFSEVDKNSLSLVGGKGANLGELTKAGFPVPEGFIVTAEAYFEFMRSTGLRLDLRNLLGDLNVNDTKTLQHTAALVKERILGVAMPQAIVTAIQAAYLQLCNGPTTIPVAVRSTATAEDLPGASFAGQQATYLNVIGANDVVEAVRKCWASLFEPRAIFYRTDKGFDHFEVGIAVPVQRMVQSDISGIMFTVDPITNDRGRIVIEAGFGLGEAIVSGSVTPDRYIVDKTNFAILDKEINEQEFKIVRKQTQGSAPEVPAPPQSEGNDASSKPQLADIPPVVMPAVEATADVQADQSIQNIIGQIIGDTTAPAAIGPETPQPAPEPPHQPVPQMTVPVAPPEEVSLHAREPDQTIEDILASVQGTGETLMPPAPSPTPTPVPVAVAPKLERPAGMASFSPLPGVVKQTSVPTDTPPASTGSLSSSDKDAFVISEQDIKQDIEALRASYGKQTTDPDQMPPHNLASDTTQSNTVVDTIYRRNVSFTFSGDPITGVTPTGTPPLAVTVEEKDPNEKVMLSPEESRRQKMSDEQIVELAKLGARIGEHYQYPQDTEWAIENGKIYLVQARPVTTLDDEVKSVPATYPDKSISMDMGLTARATKVAEELESGTTGEGPKIILKGGGASVGSASGPVKIIHSPDAIDEVLQGDVLVTEMTTPDYVPAMKRAAAIVTDTGGRTCHAAIVSRELGIPCVVGTKEATTKLKTGQIITVNGTHGTVYEGEILPPHKAVEKQIAAQPIGYEAPITATKVYVNLAEKELAASMAERPVDGVGLLRAEFMIADIGEHPKKMIEEGRSQVFIDKLAEGLRMFAEPFYPRPVIYRATDFKTNEYRNLKGGDKYEQQEDNPMIGFRGCFRYISDPEVFNLEIAAIKKVREEYDNLHVMIPFVRTVEEMRVVKELMEKAGLRRSHDFKLYMMVEVPSTAILIDKFCDLGIDGVSIGSNDLTQLILGLDRDSSQVASEFDERDEAVMWALKRIIEGCNRRGVVASICGQAPSVYPEMTEKLVEWGINSVSVNPDMIEKTRRTVASVEKKLLLRKLSEVQRQETEELDILKK